MDDVVFSEPADRKNNNKNKLIQPIPILPLENVVFKRKYSLREDKTVQELLVEKLASRLYAQKNQSIDGNILKPPSFESGVLIMVYPLIKNLDI